MRAIALLWTDTHLISTGSGSVGGKGSGVGGLVELLTTIATTIARRI